MDSPNKLLTYTINQGPPVSVELTSFSLPPFITENELRIFIQELEFIAREMAFTRLARR